MKKLLFITVILFTANFASGQVTHISYQKSYMTYGGDKNTKIVSPSRGQLLILRDQILNCSPNCSDCTVLIDGLAVDYRTTTYTFYSGWYGNEKVRIAEGITRTIIFTKNTEITYDTVGE